MNSPIAYFESRYLITNEGKVLNLANNSYLALIKNPNGYLKVGLADGNGAHKQLSIHTLVARHFIPNPYGHPQVNHLDGDKTNNHVSNLEWCTHQQNMKHAFVTGLRKGYMSADDKEMYLQQVIEGKQVKDLAVEITRRPETLHKMLRETAVRVNKKHLWDSKMKENRANAAKRNLANFINNK